MSFNRLRISFFIIILIFIVHAPIEKFFLKERTFYPLYNWELGFGHITTVAKMSKIVLLGINNKKLKSETIYHRHPLFEKSWNKTNDYKIPAKLVRAFQSGNKYRIKREKSSFEDYFFKRFNLNQVEYKIVYREYNPIESDNKSLKVIEYGPYLYTNE